MIDKLSTIPKSFFVLLIECFLLWCLFAFVYEIWMYQVEFLPTIWDKISLAEQTGININLGLMDLKIIFTLIAFLLLMNWTDGGLNMKAKYSCSECGRILGAGTKCIKHQPTEKPVNGKWIK